MGKGFGAKKQRPPAPAAAPAIADNRESGSLRLLPCQECGGPLYPWRVCAICGEYPHTQAEIYGSEV
eukprot:g21243.t1